MFTLIVNYNRHCLYQLKISTNKTLFALTCAYIEKLKPSVNRSGTIVFAVSLNNE